MFPLFKRNLQHAVIVIGAAINSIREAFIKSLSIRLTKMFPLGKRNLQHAVIVIGAAINSIGKVFVKFVYPHMTKRFHMVIYKY
jgi:hypothetical protein